MAKFIVPEREGGFYVAKEEKATLIANETELEVVAVEFGPSQFGGDRYLVTVNLNDVERGITFPAGGVESRDELLSSLADYLETEQDPEPVYITIGQVKSSAGRPVILVNVVIEDEGYSE